MVESSGQKSAGERTGRRERTAGIRGPARSSGAVRRRPVQQRSIERFERMLEACAQVLDEVGYDRLTTREVAERAGVPIGTLYQFFHGKQELCRALAERNLELFTRRLAARFHDMTVTRWSDTAAVVVAEFVAMKRTVPGFAAIDFGHSGARMPSILDVEQAQEDNEHVAHRLAEFGVQTVGLAPNAELEQVLRVAVEVVDAVMHVAFRGGLPGDPRLIAEAEWLLRSYLAARLD